MDKNERKQVESIAQLQNSFGSEFFCLVNALSDYVGSHFDSLSMSGFIPAGYSAECFTIFNIYGFIVFNLLN